MHSPAGMVDLELLRARAATIGDAAERLQVSAVIDGALACVAQVRAVDLSALERAASARAGSELWALVEAPLARVWGAVGDLRGAMAPLVLAHEARSGAGGTARESEPPELVLLEGAGNDFADELVLAGEDLERAAVAEGRVEPAPVSPRVLVAVPGSDDAASVAARIDETVWAMSFVLSSELDGFRRRRPSLGALSDGWELVSAVEEHLGHLQSALAALMTGIYASLPGAASGIVSDSEESLQLFAARELRARLFQLRDEVLALERELRVSPPSGWQGPLEKLVKLVESYVFGPAFAWMRAGDKRALLEQRRAVTEIVALWSPLRAEPARRACAGLARYLEALEVINQRECLVVHDRAALERVVEQLTVGSPPPPTAIAKALAALADCQWRDRELDALLAQTLDPGAPPPLETILARALEVLAGLGSAGRAGSDGGGAQRSSSS